MIKIAWNSAKEIDQHVQIIVIDISVAIDVTRRALVDLSYQVIEGDHAIAIHIKR